MINIPDNDFTDNKLTNIDSFAVDGNPISVNELTNKKYVADSLGGGKNLRSSLSLENYVKISVAEGVHNLTQYDLIQCTDITKIKTVNSGQDLIHKWFSRFNDKIINGKIQNFSKSTKTSSPTSHSGAISLPPNGDSCMFFETSSSISRSDNSFCNWERTDIIQITNITFYYNRFSIITISSLKSMGRFRIQLLLRDKTWSTRYNIPKNDQSSISSTQWTLVSSNFGVENFGVKIISGQIDTPHADMCFSNFSTTHSIF